MGEGKDRGIILQTKATVALKAAETLEELEAAVTKAKDAKLDSADADYKNAEEKIKQLKALVAKLLCSYRAFVNNQTALYIYIYQTCKQQL